MPAMDLGLSGRACIVTGASRGIGLATARMLCSEGADVLISARGEGGLQAATGVERGAGGRLEGVALDVTAEDAGDRIVEECLERFGRLDVLANNAGSSRMRALEQLEDDDWQEQWELNVLAPMRTMRAAVPRMVAAGRGRIVNVCSSSGKRPSLRNPAYSVTKAAQLSLSRVFAERHAADGVLVNAVAPGPVASPLWAGEGGLADQIAAAQGGTREEAIAAAGAKVPLGRLGTEEEIAAAVVFLCSEAASNVTGAAWSVDGGTFASIV